MHEQVRLWFYSQLFMSVVLEGKAPYERVLTNSAVIAEDGRKSVSYTHLDVYKRQTI